MHSKDGAAEEPVRDLEKLRVEDEDEKSLSEAMVDIENGISQSKMHNEEEPEEKHARQSSLELTRTVSNALSRVTTRMTNRHITDPGPPPGILPLDAEALHGY